MKLQNGVAQRTVCLQSMPRPNLVNGVVAQLVERLVRNEKVRGSTPLGSTITTEILPNFFPSHSKAFFVRPPAILRQPQNCSGCFVRERRWMQPAQFFNGVVDFRNAVLRHEFRQRGGELNSSSPPVKKPAIQQIWKSALRFKSVSICVHPWLKFFPVKLPENPDSNGTRVTRPFDLFLLLTGKNVVKRRSICADT